MFIFFLGVVPTIALFSFVVYYMKHNVGGTLTWKKSPATYVKHVLLKCALARGVGKTTVRASVPTVSQHVQQANHVAPRPKRDPNHNSAPPASRGRNLRELEIRPQGLISTTNQNIAVPMTAHRQAPPPPPPPVATTGNVRLKIAKFNNDDSTSDLPSVSFSK